MFCSTVKKATLEENKRGLKNQRKILIKPRKRPFKLRLVILDLSKQLQEVF